MRYRKRVNIAKGVRLNVSKSGISTTIGRPGASINIGKTGMYLNTGIPGTGVYNRHKIMGGITSSKKAMPLSNTVITDEAMYQLKEDIESETREFIDIYKLSAYIMPISEYHELLDYMKPERYNIPPFDLTEPTRDEVKSQLEAEAKSNIKTVAFWNTGAC